MSSDQSKAGALVAAKPSTEFLKRLREMRASKAQAPVTDEASRELMSQVIMPAVQGASAKTSEVVQNRKALSTSVARGSINVQGIVTTSQLSKGTKYNREDKQQITIATASILTGALPDDPSKSHMQVDTRFSFGMNALDVAATFADSHPYQSFHYFVHAANAERSKIISDSKLDAHTKESIACKPESVLQRLQKTIVAEHEREIKEGDIPCRLFDSTKKMVESGHIARLCSTFDALPSYRILSDSERQELLKRKGSKGLDASKVEVSKTPVYKTGAELEQAVDPIFSNFDTMQVAVHILAAVDFHRNSPHVLQAGVEFSVKVPVKADNPHVNDGVEVLQLQRAVNIMPVRLQVQNGVVTFPWNAPGTAPAPSSGEQEEQEANDVSPDPENFVEEFPYYQALAVNVKKSVSSSTMYIQRALAIFDAEKEGRMPSFPPPEKLQSIVIDQMAKQGKQNPSTKAVDFFAGDHVRFHLSIRSQDEVLKAQMSPNVTMFHFGNPANCKIDAIRCFKQDIDNSKRDPNMPVDQTVIAGRVPVYGIQSKNAIVSMRPVDASAAIKETETAEEEKNKYITVIDLSTLKLIQVELSLYKEELAKLFGLAESDHAAWAMLSRQVLPNFHMLMDCAPRISSSIVMSTNVAHLWSSVDTKFDADALEDLAMVHCTSNPDVYEFDDPSQASTFLEKMLSQRPHVTYSVRPITSYTDPLIWLKQAAIPVTAKRAEEIQNAQSKKTDQLCVGSAASERAYGLFNLSHKNAQQVKALIERNKNRKVHFFVVSGTTITENWRELFPTLTPEMGDAVCSDGYTTAFTDGKVTDHLKRQKIPEELQATISRLNIKFDGSNFTSTPKVLYALVVKDDEQLVAELEGIAAFMPNMSSFVDATEETTGPILEQEFAKEESAEDEATRGSKRPHEDSEADAPPPKHSPASPKVTEVDEDDEAFFSKNSA